jgi:acetyl-CoA carboxylase biotin carboxyl carrier protein
MSLSHEDVKRLLELLDASKFDELHLEMDGTKLTLLRNGAGATARACAPIVSAVLSTQPASPVSTSTQAPISAESFTDLVNIRAIMLGQFYGAPKPGAAPFVTVGSKVNRDTAIGIIEVMKLMNSIAAGVDGEIVEILARDGELVEFDQVLMRVRPA